MLIINTVSRKSIERAKDFNCSEYTFCTSGETKGIPKCEALIFRTPWKRHTNFDLIFVSKTLLITKNFER